ncbi:MAG: CocE/NonD family hydrolase [Thermoplasmatota archaeon]
MRLFSLPLTLVCAVPLLAGCVTAPVPPTVHAATEAYSGVRLEPLWFTAPDGTRIHATLYLPSNPRQGAGDRSRFGAIVNFSPYYTNLYGIDTDGRLNAYLSGARHLNQTSVGLLVAHGFAYVAASVPGTGHSSGCFEMGGLHEQTVMAQFIDWVGNASWSNGNVGMAGGSYDGTTQWMAAIHAPRHLRTIVPHVSITDMYDYEYQDGAPYAWWGPYFEPYYNLLVGMDIDPFNVPPSANPQPDVLASRLCPGVQDHLVEPEATTATGRYDSFWQARDYAAGMANIAASVLLVHGLWDWNVKPIHLDVWNRIRTEKVFWLQQMQHNVPYHDTYKAEYDRADWNATLLAWYDHYLNGAPNGVPQALPAVWVQDHTGLWRTETQWPPAEDLNETLYLGARALTRERPDPGSATFVTPPSYVGAYLEPNVGVNGPGAPDQVVAKFLTSPLGAPMRIAGVPRLLLNLSVDRPGHGHIVAELYRVHENGTWEFLDMGGRGLAQRDGRTGDEAVAPLATMAVPVNLDPTESYLEKGDRLALTLAGDDTDWFHPNGNSPTYMVRYASTLSLPLLPADAPRGVDSEAMAHLNPFFAADPKQY